MAITSIAAGAEPLSRIAFGSCCRQDRPAPIFSAIADSRPELFIWMGDNIYGDSPDPEVLRAKYRQLREHADYAPLNGQFPIIGTWDDHDYGKNDAGSEFESKVASQEAFLDFFEVPEDSPRRQRKGVYSCEDFGPEERQVRVILLDTRYHREAPGADTDVLGREQWKWLEEQLRESTAQVNLLVSSIQFLPNGARFEKWGNFPEARTRLLALLADPEMPPVVILSGDRHLGEISLDVKSAGYPLYEITSSSLNASGGGSPQEINPLRIGNNFRAANSGTLSIEWTDAEPIITLALRDVEGAPQRAVTFPLKR